MVIRKIGVDYGTSTSVIHYTDYDEATGNIIFERDILFEGSTPYVPTLVLKAGTIKDKNNKIKTTKEEFGWNAKNKTTFYTLLCENFKMDLLNQDIEKRNEGQKLTKQFFRYMYKQYYNNATHIETPPQKTVTYITYPSKFSDEAWKFLQEAAKEAGFPNVQMISEAEAAMQYTIMTGTARKTDVLSGFKNSQITVMLIDMGAGTTDIALYSYDTTKNKNHKLLGYYPKNGEVNFGGREIDELLCRFYKERFGNEILNKIGRGDESLGNSILRNDIKLFKQTNISPELSDENGNVDGMPNLLNAYWSGQDTDLDRKIFESILKNYLPQFPMLVNGALHSANLIGKQIDLVILTGGHSNWYFVKDMLLGKYGNLIDLPYIKESYGKRIISFGEDAHMAVAKGASHCDTPASKPLLKDFIVKTKKSLHIYEEDNTFPLKYNPYSRIRPVITTRARARLHNVIAIVKETGTVCGYDDSYYYISPYETKRERFKYEDWKDIVSVSIGDYKMLGLKKDGTVITSESPSHYWGYNDNRILEWHDIIAITSGHCFEAGLTMYGTINFCAPYQLGDYMEMQNILYGWHDIIAITTSSFGGHEHLIGLKRNGEVITTGNNGKEQYEINKWHDIIAISGGDNYLAGLKKDGTIVLTNTESEWQDWKNWCGIVSIYAGRYIIGLKENGTVVADGPLKEDQKHIIAGWHDIAAVADYSGEIFGITRNGTIVSTSPYILSKL